MLYMCSTLRCPIKEPHTKVPYRGAFRQGTPHQGAIPRHTLHAAKSSSH